jgi:GNAT superfamily N-acetyltransferase
MTVSNLADTAANEDWLRSVSTVVLKHLPGQHAQSAHTPKKYGGAELSYYDPDEMGHMNDPWEVADEAGLYISSDKEVAQVAIEDGQIVGAVFEAVDFPTLSYSADIAVLPEYQGRGIGSQLADAVVDNFREYQADFDLTMELDAINPMAAEMMERRGAEVVGTGPGVSSILMRMKESTNDV